MKLRRQEAEILAPDNGELMHQHVWPNVTKAEPMPRTYLSTRFLHGVCMLRECIYGECAHEQHVRRTLTLTHIITAVLSKWKCRTCAHTHLRD